MVTKRRRKMRTRYGDDDEQIQRCGTSTSIMDLPADILIDILLELSAKDIISSKYACKTLHNLISDSRFTKLVLLQENTHVLIRDASCFYLTKPQDHEHEQDLGHCLCKSKDRKCKYCRHTLKLPLCKSQVMLSNFQDDHSNSGFNEYKFVNSCNGLLCLSGPLSRDPAVVCNPITGEFMYLPKASDKDHIIYFRICGLGFCPKNNQYKVIRTFHRRMLDPSGESIFTGAEIFTLGTPSASWKIVASVPFVPYKLEYPTYLNGVLHWLFFDKSSTWIISFDLDTEQFGSHLVTPSYQRNLTIGVLGGSLSLSKYSRHDNYCRSYIDMWVMIKYGDWDSWTKLFSIDIGYDYGRCFGETCCQPISYSSNG